MSTVMGLTGVITVAVRGKDGPGEVLIKHAGGTEPYIAWSDVAVRYGALVVVTDDRGGRNVYVAEI